jgi:hypothetical protein
MQTVTQVKEALREAQPVTSLVSLIRVAIEDGRKMLAARQDIRPDWAMWYRSMSNEGPCTACFAGAVMLGTLDGLGKHRLENCDVIGSHELAIQYRRTQYAALVALDRTRRGDLWGAYSALGRWYLGDGKPERREAFRDAVERVHLERRHSTPTTTAPDDHEFVSRPQFESFLASVSELADQLESVELAHEA